MSLDGTHSSLVIVSKAYTSLADKLSIYYVKSSILDVKGDTKIIQSLSCKKLVEICT